MKKIIYITAIVGLTALCTACESYNAAEIPAEYHKVLILKEAGEMDLTLYRTGEDAKYGLCIMKAGSEDGLPADANLIISSEWLDGFNADNASGYTMLPSQYYSLETENVQFGGNDKYRIVNLSFKTTDLATLIDENPDLKYALPIQLESSNTTISKANNYLILRPSVVIPTVGFKDAGYQKTIMTSTDPEQLNVSIPIEIPIDNIWDFDCEIGINEELLNAYNQDNGTSYLMLPASSYQAELTCKFSPGNKSAKINLMIDRSKIEKGSYILPLELQSCSKDGFEIDALKKVHLFGINYAPDKIELTEDMLSSNATVPNDGTGLLGLIDGLGAGKHFHSDYDWNYHDPKYGHYIDVQLSTPINNVMLNYYTRWENGAGAPLLIKLYIKGNDDAEWTELATIDKGLPMAGNAEYMSDIFHSETSFTQIRFSVVRSASGILTETNGSFFNLGEFSLYGE